MLRLIRTVTLDTLRADSAELATAREQLDHAKTEAATATDAAINAETAAEKILRDLAQAHADRIQAERDARQARDELVQAKADTAQQLTELGEDFAKLRDAAADTETGETIRGALAYNVLRDLYADAWAQGLLPKRPFDVLAAVLGFDAAQHPAKTPA